MNSIQRLEQLPIRKKETAVSLLKEELTHTAKLLAPSLSVSVTARAKMPISDKKASNFCEHERMTVNLDHGLFLTVAENLIGNAARFARRNLSITLAIDNSNKETAVSFFRMGSCSNLWMLFMDSIYCSIRRV